MVCYELATERIPYADLELETFDYPEIVAVERVRPDLAVTDLVASTRALPDDVIASIIDTITRGWSHDPAERPTVASFVAALQTPRPQPTATPSATITPTARTTK